MSLNNLAALYYAQGRYADAEPLYRRALAVRLMALGPDHPDVAQSLNNLAVLYQVQRRFEEAETRFEWALAIREKALAPDHPDLAESLENYAAVLWETGRDAEAAKMDARAKAIRAKHVPTVTIAPQALPRESKRWPTSSPAMSELGDVQ